MQTRLGSLIETCINTAIGFSINFCANLLVLPHFGYTPTLGENLVIGMIFTFISVARGYVLRRWFNASLHRMAEKLGR